MNMAYKDDQAYDEAYGPPSSGIKKIRNNPLISYHLQHFYNGCILNRGKITKEDRATGERMKKYLNEIDWLKAYAD